MLPFTYEEDGGGDLSDCGSHCSSHFLINVVDKTVAYHLMRMQQAMPG